jgi:hypothetical protein
VLASHTCHGAFLLEEIEIQRARRERTARTPGSGTAVEIIQAAIAILDGILNPQKETGVVASSSIPLFLVGMHHNRSRADGSEILMVLTRLQATDATIFSDAGKFFPTGWRDTLGETFTKDMISYPSSLSYERASRRCRCRAADSARTRPASRSPLRPDKPSGLA